MLAYLLSSFSVALGIIRRLNSQNLFLYVSLNVSCPFAVLVWLLSLSLSPFLVFYRAHSVLGKYRETGRHPSKNHRWMALFLKEVWKTSDLKSCIKLDLGLDSSLQRFLVSIHSSCLHTSLTCLAGIWFPLALCTRRPTSLRKSFAQVFYRSNALTVKLDFCPKTAMSENAHVFTRAYIQLFYHALI